MLYIKKYIYIWREKKTIHIWIIDSIDYASVMALDTSEERSNNNINQFFWFVFESKHHNLRAYQGIESKCF